MSVNQPDDPDGRGLPASVEAFCKAAETHVLPALPQFGLDDARDNPAALVISAVVHRQLSAIRGAVVLTQNGLGHLTLPLTRPACEERIRLTYLLSLEPEDQDLLISLMVRLEGALMVEAQQKYFGSKTMKRLGFAKQFVTGQAANRADAGEKLAVLGERLGWKAEPGGLPTTGWLASTRA